MTEAKVARIIGKREVAFTAGSDDGVQVGDRAEVYRAYPVHDPESDEELGVAKRVLVRLKIIESQDRFSVGRTYESVPQSAFAAIAALSAGERGIVEVQEGSQSDDEFDPAARIVLVKRGDPVFIYRPPKPDSPSTQEVTDAH